MQDKSECLTRDSWLVQTNDALRRNRKALLSDLSSLVKTAKTLQEYGWSTRMLTEEVSDVVDEMILKAFRIVTRGVRFTDAYEEERRTRLVPHRIMSTLREESIPPTPPADRTLFDDLTRVGTVSAASSRSSASYAACETESSEEQTKRQSYKRISSLPAVSASIEPTMSSRSNRRSVSHRVVPSGPSLVDQRRNFASERLTISHDMLLSYLGSFIGRLHLELQSSTGLLLTIQQSITSGRGLLLVIQNVWARDSQRSLTLKQATDAMYDCIQRLVLETRDILRSSRQDYEDVIIPEDSRRLMAAATGCVKAAGDCVANARFVIDRIGDFELEPVVDSLGINVAAIGTSRDESAALVRTPRQPLGRTVPPPLVIPAYEKPLPNVPSTSAPAYVVVTAFDDANTHDAAIFAAAGATPRSSTRSLLPPLPKMTSPLMSQEDYSPSEQSSSHDGDFQPSDRSRSTANSSAGTTNSYLSSMRDSELSMVSQTSTRATTPDMSAYVPEHRPTRSDISFNESQTTAAEDSEETESRILEKTFATELLYNKDGQITGGSLPALVERLTTHDSTPDAMFVSTFYLTFRLFVCPVRLAETLVERFDDAAQSPAIANPIRLRVYNVFKGWLESHWREQSDHDALSVVDDFAKMRLSVFLPNAAMRLSELARKVSSTEMSLVPRLVSSMGKTSTSIAQYIPPDTALPTPNMTKSQTASLKAWKIGGALPSILDFDPLELARQITIKEMNIFCAIMPEELLATEWIKKSGSNAINVRAMSTLSTDLSNLVADTILNCDDIKKRALMIKQWIKTAHRCLELNNYDSLMAILCSLSSTTIMRLTKTWDLISEKRQKMLRALQQIVDSAKNYTVLRQRLHDHVPPCLPFVGTYLTDLTFIDVGNPAMKQLPSGMTVINFDKHTRTARIIGELQRFQIPYRLTEVPELQEWLQAQIVRVKSSDQENVGLQFHRKSLLLEPKMVTITAKHSPIEAQHSFGAASTTSKEKFDLFGWTHPKDRQHVMTAL